MLLRSLLRRQPNQRIKQVQTNHFRKGMKYDQSNDWKVRRRYLKTCRRLGRKTTKPDEEGRMNKNAAKFLLFLSASLNECYFNSNYIRSRARCIACNRRTHVTGAYVIKKFQHIVVVLCLNSALQLNVASQKAIIIQFVLWAAIITTDTVLKFV